MSRGDFGYGSTVREYRDDPVTGGSGGSRDDFQSRGSPAGSRGAYQGTGRTSFNELSDHISTNIFTINSNATTLERTTRQIATDKDSVQLRDKIHSTEQYTNDLVNDTTKLFRQLSSVCTRQQKLQFERLSSEFRETVQRYNTLQKKVAEKVRSTAPLPNQTRKTHPQSDLIGWGEERDDDEEQLIENERRRQQLQAQEEIIDVDVALLQEREERIRQLESDILDINEIFRDLGTLVHEQGEVIDSIEHNVETAYDHVEAGRDQLVKASTYQRKARKKKCIIVVICLIVVAVLALIIYFSVKH